MIYNENRTSFKLRLRSAFLSDNVYNHTVKCTSSIKPKLLTIITTLTAYAVTTVVQYEHLSINNVFSGFTKFTEAINARHRLSLYTVQGLLYKVLTSYFPFQLKFSD